MKLARLVLLTALIASAPAWADATITPKHIDNVQRQLVHMQRMIEAGLKAKQFNAEEVAKLHAKHAESGNALRDAQADGQVSEAEYLTIQQRLAELKTLLYTLGKNPGEIPLSMPAPSPYQR